MYAYRNCLEVGSREQVTKDHALEFPHVQQHTIPEVAQLL